jgi:hypothetical protein
VAYQLSIKEKLQISTTIGKHIEKVKPRVVRYHPGISDNSIAAQFKVAPSLVAGLRKSGFGRLPKKYEALKPTKVDPDAEAALLASQEAAKKRQKKVRQAWDTKFAALQEAVTASERRTIAELDNARADYKQGLADMVARLEAIEEGNRRTWDKLFSIISRSTDTALSAQLRKLFPNGASSITYPSHSPQPRILPARA